MSEQATEEKEPPSYLDSIEEKIGALKKSLRDKFLGRQKPIEKRLEELKRVAQEGDQVRALVESKVWNEKVVPFLKSEGGGVRPWTPGQAFDPYDVEANHFFYSGKAKAVENLFSRLKYWIEEGARAQDQVLIETERMRLMKKRVDNNPA